MKQVLQSLKTGETLVAEVPVPQARPGMVLVRTAASLVSAGTERMVVSFAEKNLVGKARSRPDLARQVLDKARREGLLTTVEAAFNRLDQPMALGYASAGTIVALGEGVEGWQVGERVACAGGGYAVHAEYAVAPVNLLARLPENVDFESAAFTTLGAIALHGFRLAEAQIGETVAVIGLGLLGLLGAQIARAAGCRVLGIDLSPERVALAHRLGLQAVPRPEAEAAVLAFSRGRGADVVLICADTPSNDPVTLAGALARDRARVVAIGAVGLEIPRKVYYEKELSFINSRSYGPGRYDPAYEEGGQDYPLGYVRWTEGRNLEAVVDLLASGALQVQPLISHRFPIARAPEAYELILGKRGEPFLGVVLTYGEWTTEDGRQTTEGGRRTTDDRPLITEGGQRTVDDRRQARPAPSDSLTLGVLGAGNFATAVMLPALKKVPGLTLGGVVSASGVSAAHAQRKFGFRYAASDPDRLLADPAINVVAVLTRHDLHAPQVMAALQAGKHVFCEKPLALNAVELAAVFETIDGGKQMVDGGQVSRPLLTVGFNRRFAPLAQRMAAFFAGRGEPMVAHYRVNAGYIPLTHWLHDPAQGGGRIIGEGCHFVDFLTFLVGAPPVRVHAHALPDGGRYRADNVVLTFTFPDGSLGTLTYLANGDKAFPKERVEAFAGGRVAVLDDFRTLETVANGRRRVQRSRLRQDKGHRAEWLAFAEAIRSGGPPSIPYEHIRGVHLAVYAAVEALRSAQPQEIR
ncbi:MAG: bi-domain-containing oxidoreductase [Anaerolineales bacterium]